MTHAELNGELALPAGDPLDRIVARAVFGHLVGPLRYSTSISTAWRVVSEMNRRGRGLYLVERYDRGTKTYLYEASFFSRECGPLSRHVLKAEAETAPLAICRAALRALWEGQP